jgi:uncharacterized damage-inducible protein DinB
VSNAAEFREDWCFRHQMLLSCTTPHSAEIAKLAHWRLKPKMEAIKHGPVPKAQLIEQLEKCNQEVDGAFSRLSEEQLLTRFKVEKCDTTVLQAVHHVIEHFSYHLGQILYIYKMRTGMDPRFYNL